MASNDSSFSIVIPLVIVLAVVGAAVLFTFGLASPAPAMVAPVAAPTSPFADMPEEQAPDSSPGRSKSLLTELPDLSGNPYAKGEVWENAESKARDGEDFYQQALKARDQSDHSQFSELGRKSKTLFEAAIKGTADFQVKLVEEHGDTSSQVRAVIQTRDFWKDRQLFLHKFAR